MKSLQQPPARGSGFLCELPPSPCALSHGAAGSRDVGKEGLVERETKEG